MNIHHYDRDLGVVCVRTAILYLTVTQKNLNTDTTPSELRILTAIQQQKRLPQ